MNVPRKCIESKTRETHWHISCKTFEQQANPEGAQMIAISCYLHTEGGILHTDCCEIDTREDYPPTETERVLGQAVQVAMRAVLRTIHARYKVQATVTSEEIKDFAQAAFLAAAGKWKPSTDIEPVERPRL